MHRKYPEPVVMPSPHSRGHQQQQHQAQPERDNNQQHDGSAAMSDDYDLDVGLAGALK